MKLTFNRLEFLQAARKLCKVAPETSPVSTLTGILLEADAQNFEVNMTSTNLEVSMSCSLSAAVIEGGSTVINAVLFTDMLRLLGEATVTMEVLPNLQMQVNSGSASYTIMTLNAADYPKIKLPEPVHTAVITNLHTLVKSTAFVVPKATQNLSLKCVKLEISGNNVRTAGTDGMRLMTCKKQLEDKNAPLTLLIPCDCFSLLAGMVEDSDKLTLESSTKYAVFTGEQMIFTTRLGVGSYIDVDSVLGCITGCYEALADAKELYTALDVLAAVASASDQVRLIFTPGGLSLFCNGEDITSRSQAMAQVITPTPPEGFCYPLKHFHQGVAMMNGTLKLSVSENGLLLVSNDEQTFMLSSARPKAKAVKTPSVKKTTKKTKTTKKSADKAA